MTFEYLPGHFVKIRENGRTIARAHSIVDSAGKISWVSGGAQEVFYASEADAVRTIATSFALSALKALVD